MTELKIRSWGTVYPCCHFGHIAKHPRENQQYYKAQLIDIFKDKDISLKSRTLKDILDDSCVEKIEVNDILDKHLINNCKQINNY